MKLKTYYYCLTDSNNKPDFRFIFTNKIAAEKKRQQIKNSIVGETIFVSKHKRDYFVDGVKKDFIDKTKPIDIKKGCWTTLQVKKISLLDTIKPEMYFKKIIKETSPASVSQPVLEFTKKPATKLNSSIKTTSVPAPDASTSNTVKAATTDQEEIKPSQKKFSSTYFTKQSITESLNTFKVPKNYSFLNTKLFAINFAIVLVICFATIFYVSSLSNKELSLALADKQQLLITERVSSEKEIAVLGSMHENGNDSSESTTQAITKDNIDAMVFDTLIKFEEVRSDQLEESIKKMVAGTPMEKMAPYIAKKDKIVAAFLVGISKKESNYGRRVPVLNGEDCFNYWGYRGIRKRMGSGGHTCFDSPEDAIETVGGRIERLVKSGVDTPEEMVLWKCGSDCNATGGWPAARKWIKDVNMYYTKMLDTATTDAAASKKIRILDNTTTSS